MEIQLIKEPNSVFETATLLFDGRNGSSCRELKEAIRKKYEIDSAVLDSCFDSIIEASEFVCAGVEAEADPALMDFLFSRHSSMTGCFAGYIIHDVCRRSGTDEELLAALREAPKNVFFVNLFAMLSDEFPSVDTDPVTNYAELFSFIEKLPVPEDEKFQLCRLYNGYEEYREQLSRILETAISLYRAKFDIIRHYISWFIAAVNEPLTNDAEGFLQKNYGLKPEDSAPELCVAPSVAMCNGTRHLLSYTTQDNVDYLYVGALFEPLREITDVTTADERVCKALRILGDSRKFEILKLLTDGPKYGQQIASLLDITTATVSHHMSLLLEAGFVEIRRESNRIYYTIGRKKLRDFIEELAKTLLG
ncbi:MAG: winged helix-turn-helix domain-containing protein [Clostridia bacterium]|nr:winged helix-turn-helix domain-containing protein [Clostridia bacterium]